MAAIPRYIVVTAWLAGGIAAVQAAVIAILCCIALLTYNSCIDETPLNGKGYFFHILKTHYLKDPACTADALFEGGVLDAERVRVWVIISLSFSLLWLVVSAVLILVADSSEEVPHTAFKPVALTWVAATSSVLVVNITIGILFAIDYSLLNDALSSYEGGTAEAYPLDMVRFAAFLLMTLSFQGYAFLVCNTALAGVIAALAVRAGKIVAISEHSVHSRGILSAFSAPPNKQDNDPWRQQQNYDSLMYERSSHLNRACENSSTRSWQEPPSPAPAPLSADVHGRGFDRSDSWHPVKQISDVGGSRPFSYLEELRARGSPAAAAAAAPWRRPRGAWDAPHPPPAPSVPAPDYSPKQARKLKSSLKPNY